MITLNYFEKDQSLQSFSLSTDRYLTHYWPIENGEMKDVIDSKDMEQGNLTSFIEDRFCNPNSALALNGGWAQVPSGIYFDTQEFTISVWVYPQQIGYASRVINFGPNYIIFRLDSGSNNLPALNIHNKNESIGTCKSSKELVNGEWQFLTATFNGSLESLYINGELTCNLTVTSYNLPAITRLYNYIGKSHIATNGYSWSYIDDLRFYNKSLNEFEIIRLMNQTSKNTNLNNYFLSSKLYKS